MTDGSQGRTTVLNTGCWMRPPSAARTC